MIKHKNHDEMNARRPGGMPPKRTVCGSFTKTMTTLPLRRRQAFVFAMGMELSLRAVVGLTWHRLRTMHCPGLSAAIVASLPRHITLSYVFWEYQTAFHTATPLFGIEEDVQLACGGRTLDGLMATYSDWLRRVTSEELRTLLGLPVRCVKEGA